MKEVIWGLTIALLLSSNPALADDADAVLGDWFTEDGKALVKIYKQAGIYNGKIVWLKNPLNEDGAPKQDINNPDDSLKIRPLIGLNLVQGFTYKGGNKWADGQIYDPDNGKTYSCKMTLKRDDTLKVRGFVGVSLLGRTTVWQRKQ